MYEEEPFIEPELLTGNCCMRSKACDPQSKLHRYLMLIFICLLSFGSYFCYDNPAALEDAFLNDVHLSVTQFMNLYSFYSWPNVALSLLGGFLIDRVFGIHWGAIIFSAIIFCGQIILGLGVYFDVVPLMYFARFIFGIGGECLAVAQNTYATAWYHPNELNFVFGLSLSIARIGSTVNMNTMQLLNVQIGKSLNLSGSQQVGVSILVASVTCIFSLACAIILAFFYERFLKSSALLLNTQVQEGSLSNSEPINIDSEIQETLPNDKQITEEKIKLVDVIHFPLGIWLICIICVAFYVTIFPFISLGLVYFERKYNMPPSSAAAVNSMVFIVSAVASPLFGAVTDCFGRNLVWVASGILLTMSCHAYFALSTVETVITPAVTMFTLGLSYSILASNLWPMVGIILPPHQRATAYGLVQSVQNLGLGLISLLTGYIVDSKGYLFLELFFLICLSFALVSTLALFLWDLRNGRKLNARRNSFIR